MCVISLLCLLSFYVISPLHHKCCQIGRASCSSLCQHDRRQHKSDTAKIPITNNAMSCALPMCEHQHYMFSVISVIGRQNMQGLQLFLSCASCNNSICQGIFKLDPQNHEDLTGIHVSCFVITNNHNMITIFFQFPVAIHLSLSLNPVAAVCPQCGLGLSNYGGAWGEAGDSSCVMERAAVTVNYNQI